MLKFLNEPYPLGEESRKDFFFALATGAFIAFFLIVFQPFGTYSFQMTHKHLFLAGYGVIASLVIIVFRFVIPSLFPQFCKEENWTVGKQILLLLIAFAVGLISCYLYKSIFLGEVISVRGLFGFVIVVSSVLIFPIMGYVTLDYVRRLKQYQQAAQQFNEQHPLKAAAVSQTPTLSLTDEQEKEVLELTASNLLYLKGADNYVEIYQHNNGEIKRDILRNTLKSMETQLDLPQIVRCHRSYLVNLQHVNQVSGNAQGYHLHLEDLETTVPVSRSRSKEVLQLLDKFI